MRPSALNICDKIHLILCPGKCDTLPLKNCHISPNTTNGGISFSEIVESVTVYSEIIKKTVTHLKAYITKCCSVSRVFVTVVPLFSFFSLSLKKKKKKGFYCHNYHTLILLNFKLEV